MTLAQIVRLGCIFLAVPQALAAQTSASVAKGQSVTLRVPIAALKYDHSNFVGVLSLSSGSLAVNESTDWRRLGFTGAKPLKVNDVKTDTKTGKVLVKLDASALKVVDIYLELDAADTAVAFTKIFGASSETEATRAASVASVADWLFGDTAQMSRSDRDQLLAIGTARHPWDTVTDAFQERRYLRVEAPEPTYIYNNNQTSVAERQAGTINEVAFPLLKQLGGVAPSYPASLGFLVVVGVKSKDMAGQYAWLNSTARDELRLYVPAAVAGAFARAEITNQDLIDKSVVLFKGNRIKVDLTK